MIVISDTSPLIAFASLGKLSVLKELFGRVSVPQAVHEELSHKGHFPFERRSKNLKVISISEFLLP